jgi:hypothetical protein
LAGLVSLLIPKNDKVDMRYFIISGCSWVEGIVVSVHVSFQDEVSILMGFDIFMREV